MDVLMFKSLLSRCQFFFFFFQAEDGIRDLTVTGVQTCALPIYLEAVHIQNKRWEQDQRQHIRQKRRPAEQNQQETQVHEIGRASCRERVKISMVAVSLKKKKKKIRST